MVKFLSFSCFSRSIQRKNVVRYIASVPKKVLIGSLHERNQRDGRGITALGNVEKVEFHSLNVPIGKLELLPFYLPTILIKLTYEQKQSTLFSMSLFVLVKLTLKFYCYHK